MCPPQWGVGGAGAQNSHIYTTFWDQCIFFSQHHLPKKKLTFAPYIHYYVFVCRILHRIQPLT